MTTNKESTTTQDPAGLVSQASGSTTTIPTQTQKKNIDMKQEPEESPQDQPAPDDQPSATETEKEPEIIPGSLEDDDPNINTIQNPLGGHGRRA